MSPMMFGHFASWLKRVISEGILPYIGSLLDKVLKLAQRLPKINNFISDFRATAVNAIKTRRIIRYQWAINSYELQTTVLKLHGRKTFSKQMSEVEGVIYEFHETLQHGREAFADDPVTFSIFELAARRKLIEALADRYGLNIHIKSDDTVELYS